MTPPAPSDELAFLDATAQAALVRAGGVDTGRAGRRRHRAHRAGRPGPQRGRHPRLRGRPRGGRVAGPAGRPAARRPVPAQGHRRQPGRACRPSSGNRLLARPRPPRRRPTPSWAPASGAAGLVTLGKTNLPELGSSPTTQPLVVRAHRQPVGPDPLAGRLQRRGGGRGRRRAGPDRPRQRRRRLDPAAGGLVRAGRAQAEPGPHAVARVDRPPTVELVVSRSVRDTAAVLDATHGSRRRRPLPARPTDRPLRRRAGPGRRAALRVACSPTAPATTSTPTAWPRPRTPAALLEGMGHHVEPVDGSVLFGGDGRVNGSLWMAGIARHVDRLGELAGRDRSPPRRSSPTTGRRPSGTARCPPAPGSADAGAPAGLGAAGARTGSTASTSWSRPPPAARRCPTDELWPPPRTGPGRSARPTGGSAASRCRSTPPASRRSPCRCTAPLTACPWASSWWPASVGRTCSSGSPPGWRRPRPWAQLRPDGPRLNASRIRTDQNRVGTRWMQPRASVQK